MSTLRLQPGMSGLKKAYFILRGHETKTLGITALDYGVLPPLWEWLGEGPCIFQHDRAPVHNT